MYTCYIIFYYIYAHLAEGGDEAEGRLGDRVKQLHTEGVQQHTLQPGDK
jgi:hypothetical protein